jgi:hypothetical protein
MWTLSGHAFIRNGCNANSAIGRWRPAIRSIGFRLATVRGRASAATSPRSVPNAARPSPTPTWLGFTFAHGGLQRHASGAVVLLSATGGESRRSMSCAATNAVEQSMGCLRGRSVGSTRSPNPAFFAANPSSPSGATPAIARRPASRGPTAGGPFRLSRIRSNVGYAPAIEVFGFASLQLLHDACSAATKSR